MPVSDLHPQYENKQYELRQMRDSIEGPSSIKRAGALYLPIPSAMYSAGDSQPQTGILIDQNNLKNNRANLISNAPWSHNIPAYSSYLQRARFPDITALLSMGLTGIAIKKDPETELKGVLSYLEESATKDGRSLKELFYYCVNEVVSVGRISLLLEVDEISGGLYINTYSAESFINWKKGYSGMEKSTEVAKLAVFEEPCDAEDADEFTTSQEDICHLVLRNKTSVYDEELKEEISLDYYNVQRYIDDSPIEEAVIPVLRGVPIPFVPLVTINAYGVGLDMGNCPLIGVSDIAISIYQKDADTSNAEFLTCNPMLVTTGVQEGNDQNGNPIPAASFPIGSNVTLNLPDTESTAFYVEPASNCLSHMMLRIQDLKEEAVQYGASILSSENKTSEAAETVRLRQSGNSSSLRTIIQSVGEGIEQILQYAYMWEKNSRLESKEIVFRPNLELTESTLPPQEMTALLQSFLNKAISHETLLLNYKKGGIKLSSETIEEEITSINNAKPLLDE